MQPYKMTTSSFPRNEIMNSNNTAITVQFDTTTKTTTGCTTNNDDPTVLYRIALYYCYIPISDVSDMIKFHETILQPTNSTTTVTVPIHGRVRIASEGINGVLSGLYTDLQHYEQQLRSKLDATIIITTTTKPYYYELDIKYCLLRTDLPVLDQLFTNLIIQNTNQVVGLVETLPTSHGSSAHNKTKKTGYSRNRRQRRKHRNNNNNNNKQQFINKLSTEVNKLKDSNDNDDDDDVEENQENIDANTNQSDTLIPVESVHSTEKWSNNDDTISQSIVNNNNNNNNDNTSTMSKVLTPKDVFQKALENEEEIFQTNCEHLPPTKWNELIQQLASTDISQSDTTTTKNETKNETRNDNDDNTTTNSTTSSKKTNDIILLDCRNVYESNIGYFQTDNVTTVLTNTRKFSELPEVLYNQSDRLLQASHIFMYCTGGVRCERASTYLHTLLQEKSLSLQQHQQQQEQIEQDGNNHGANEIVTEEDREVDDGTKNDQQGVGPKPTIPKIYQLHGGIQRYLECPDNTMFHGKNFVFDPRRTDPIVGGSHKQQQQLNDETTNTTNNTNDETTTTTPTVVGRCLVCNIQHDDYDNGYSPVLNKEARCYKCRILMLVCPKCRSTVRCWGDSDTSTVVNDASQQLPTLYCGGLESQGGLCYHMPPVREL